MDSIFRAVRFAQILLSLVGLLVSPAIASMGERITSLVCDAEINADSTIAVTETIQVVTAGEQIQRGIVRHFPLSYTGDDGKRYEVDFRFDGALIDGLDVPWHLEATDDEAIIYIGDPDIILEPGSYEFVLAYTSSNHIRYAAGHAMLNYNATGVWDFPVDSAEAVISLPDVIPPEDVLLGSYTGVEGSTDSATKTSLVGRTCRFRTTRPLGVEEQLTVLVEFPESALTAEPVLNLAGSSVKPAEPVTRTPRSTRSYNKDDSSTSRSDSSDSDSTPWWVLLGGGALILFGFGRFLQNAAIHGDPSGSTYSESYDDTPTESFISTPSPSSRSQVTPRQSSRPRSVSRPTRSFGSTRSSRSSFRSGSSGKGSGGGRGGGW